MQPTTPDFLSAEALAIPEEWRDALIKTLELMEGGQLRHVGESERGPYKDTKRVFSGLFNMQRWATPFECGTVACIGGTAQLISGVRFEGLNRDSRLHDLFYPDTEVCPDGSPSYNLITVEQAAHATRNYLTTGDAKWAEVLQ